MKIKKLIFLIVVIFLFGLLVYQGKIPNTNREKESIYEVNLQNSVNKYFSIEKGNFWEYEGIKTENIGEGKIETTNIKKRVEVVDIQTVSNGKLAILTGDDSYSKVLFRDNILDFNSDETTTDKFILTFPLAVGQKWGNEAYRDRNDGYYMWEVEQKFSQEVLGKKYADCFRIALKMLTGTEHKIFCYGIGIIEEGYKHNGTFFEETYKLTGLKSD